MIIGISGRKQSGKDTIAKMIQYLSLSDVSHTRVNQISFQKWKEKDDSIIMGFYGRYSSGNVSDWIILRFADKPKDLVCTLINCTRADLENEEFKNTPILFGYTPRQLLQLIGTQFGRNTIHKNIWVHDKLKNYDNNCKWILVDTRFHNELIGIKKQGGVVIRVVRPGLDESDTHESETELTDDSTHYDYVIENDGDIEKLLTRVVEIYNHICLFFDII